MTCWQRCRQEDQNLLLFESLFWGVFNFKVRCRFLLQLPIYSYSSSLFYLKEIFPENIFYYKLSLV